MGKTWRYFISFNGANDTTGTLALKFKAQKKNRIYP